MILKPYPFLWMVEWGGCFHHGYLDLHAITLEIGKGSLLVWPAYYSMNGMLLQTSLEGSIMSLWIGKLTNQSLYVCGTMLKMWLQPILMSQIAHLSPLVAWIIHSSLSSRISCLPLVVLKDLVKNAENCVAMHQCQFLFIMKCTNKQKKKQLDINNNLGLIQDVETHWNSSFNMLQRIFQHRVAIAATLIEHPVTGPDRTSPRKMLWKCAHRCTHTRWAYARIFHGKCSLRHSLYVTHFSRFPFSQFQFPSLHVFRAAIHSVDNSGIHLLRMKLPFALTSTLNTPGAKTGLWLQETTICLLPCWGEAREESWGRLAHPSCLLSGIRDEHSPLGKEFYPKYSPWKNPWSGE